MKIIIATIVSILLIAQAPAQDIAQSLKVLRFSWTLHPYLSVKPTEKWYGSVPGDAMDSANWGWENLMREPDQASDWIPYRLIEGKADVVVKKIKVNGIPGLFLDRDEAAIIHLKLPQPFETTNEEVVKGHIASLAEQVFKITPEMKAIGYEQSAENLSDEGHTLWYGYVYAGLDLDALRDTAVNGFSKYTHEVEWHHYIIYYTDGHSVVFYVNYRRDLVRTGGGATPGGPGTNYRFTKK